MAAALKMQWDLDARLQVLWPLAANPDVRVEAAERGEPGAMAAPIALKLSQNAQFHDRPGACKLTATAAGCGDRAMTLAPGRMPCQLTASRVAVRSCSPE